MLNGRSDHAPHFRIGLHRILHVIDHLIKLGIVDQLLAEMRQEDRFQEDVKRLAAALRIVARNMFDSLPDKCIEVFRAVGSRLRA
jgi:hypothetical protein